MGWFMDKLRAAVGGGRSAPMRLQASAGVPLDLEEAVGYRLGTSVGNALAAVEVCASHWQSAFEHANVEVDGRSVYAERDMGKFRYAITPRMMGQIGRAFIREGEVVFLKRDRPMGLFPEVYFLLAQSQNIQGAADPMFWRYDVMLNGPSGNQNANDDGIRRERYRDVPASEVAHFMYATYFDTPWVGMSPLLGAKKTFSLMRNVEELLLSETTAKTGYIALVPSSMEVELEDGSRMNSAEYIKEKYLAASSRMAFFEGNDLGPGESAMQRELWRQVRFGFLMEDSNREFRNDLRDDICAACGVPTALVASNQPSASIREGMRQFSDNTIAPKLRVVADELSEKIGKDVRIVPDLSHDIASIGRAWGALTGKMDPMSSEEANKVVGIRYG